jgi:hypothetical protein
VEPEQEQIYPGPAGRKRVDVVREIQGSPTALTLSRDVASGCPDSASALLHACAHGKVPAMMPSKAMLRPGRGQTES